MHSEASDAASPPGTTGRFSSSGIRLRGAVIAAGCLVVLVLACTLTPRMAGHGTHEELGFPSCGFLVRTGYPCPNCGLTTSLAAAVRGRFLAALRAQPFGVFLFAGILLCLAVGTTELVTGRNVFAALRPGWWWVLAALGAMLAGWGLKVVTGLLSGHLPLR